MYSVSPQLPLHLPTHRYPFLSGWRQVRQVGRKRSSFTITTLMYNLHFFMKGVYILVHVRNGRRGPGRGCLVLFTNTFYTFFYETCKIFISVHFNHVLLLSYTERYLPRFCSIFLYVFFAFVWGGGGLTL
jgi:hypothetical protein